MNSIYKNYIKRLLDIIISFSSLIILLPIMTVVYILILLNLGSPVLFKQERPGKDGRIFVMYKFRSMLNLEDSNGNTLSDEQRLTRFGKILRSTSLDELPSLFNILKGDMSLVGPRPLLVSYLNLYNDFQHRRHEVRPGLTGLAQVNGRNAISWESRFNLDIEYIESVSFFNDAKIILKTFKKVFIREGITSTDSSTMEAFKGNE